MKHQITVQNVKCNGCVQTIESELTKLTGVSNISVDEKTGFVEFDSESDTILEVTAKLAELGYPVA